MLILQDNSFSLPSGVNNKDHIIMKTLLLVSSPKNNYELVCLCK